MNRIKFVLSVVVSKILYFACKMLGSRASTAPGKYARKICPDIISILSKKIKKQIIVVCGTNGKTTTNNLINTTLLRAGYKTVCNNVGANMLDGVAAAFCKSAGFFGTLNADYACLEVDEANLKLLFKQMSPSIIVVTNLFRDQLDRYGEVDTTSKLLKTAFDLAPDAKLILNADDPTTSAFGDGREAIYYSIDGKVDMLSCNEMRDGAVCQKCGEPLVYEYYLYGRLGRYKCQKCGDENKTATYKASGIAVKDGILHFDITRGDFAAHAESEVTGLYNVYNMLMAYAAADIVGIDNKSVLSVLCSQKPEPGRMSRFEINSKIIYLLLSKNPIGFNQSVTTVINDNREKNVLLGLNDLPQDGEDISWIWDVDFETLLKGDAKHYYIVGERRFDMYLRLKYSGCDEEKISVFDSIDVAIGAMLSDEQAISYLLVNYSVMYPMYQKLKTLEGGDDK